MVYPWWARDVSALPSLIALPRPGLYAVLSWPTRSLPRQNNGYDDRRYLPTADAILGPVSAVDRGSLGGPPFTGLGLPSSLLYSVAGALYHLMLLGSSEFKYDLARPPTWIIAFPWHLVGMLAARAARTHLPTPFGISRLVGNGGSILPTGEVPN